MNMEYHSTYYHFKELQRSSIYKMLIITGKLGLHDNYHVRRTASGFLGGYISMDILALYDMVDRILLICEVECGLAKSKDETYSLFHGG